VVRGISRQVSTSQPIDELLRRLNATLRGWAGHFRAGVSSAVFSYLNHDVWQTVSRWIRRKHPKSTWKRLRRQYCGGRWWPTGDETTLIDLSNFGTTRYRYRGSVISTPWPDTDDGEHQDTTTGLVERPVHGEMHAGFGKRGPEKRNSRKAVTALRADFHHVD
jgi:RNA-directed DNA polymerase